MRFETEIMRCTVDELREREDLLELFSLFKPTGPYKSANQYGSYPAYCVYAKNKTENKVLEAVSGLGYLTVDKTYRNGKFQSGYYVRYKLTELGKSWFQLKAL